MQLNHTIVPAHDKVASAKFFSEILGLRLCPPMGWNGGRGLYFEDPNGHVLELLTQA